jgi:thiamine biosynthesis lipoprotein
MDTIMELQIAGREDYTPQAEETIRNIEKSLSVMDPESQISKLNSSGEAEISEQVADIMTRALDLCKRTDGDLDITIYPVLKAWGFTTGKYRVPSDEELQELLAKVDYRNVKLLPRGNGADEDAGDSGENGTGSDDMGLVANVTLPEGVQVDLGSVAKGYTGEYVAEKLRKLGVTSALLNLGGNVQCIGTKPNGEKWKVAVKSPFPDSATGMLGVVSADDVAIITSGGYERYFEEDGEIYWHILDPRTGKPARSGLASVTIIGKDGLLCDGLSTALFIKGLDEAVEFWKASDDFEAVFVTEDGEVYVTEGVAKDFTLTAEYSNAPLHVVSR